MKKVLSIILVAVVCVVLVIWIKAGKSKMPGADPDELWNHITKEAPYQEWKFWPDHQGMQPGKAPHGPLHKVYVNDILLNSPQPPVEYGAIAVKENYNASGELQALTVMYKIKDYNPDAGDWFWAKYTLDGKAGPAGKPIGCVTCHGARTDNDFILVHEFGELEMEVEAEPEEQETM